MTFVSSREIYLVTLILSIDPEVVELDVIQALGVKRIFQLILDVVERDQDELAD